jgi:hypothetical protein
MQKTEHNIVSDITTVWRCEDTNDRTEHRIGHHNSVKVWRYKRQNLLWCPIRCSVLSFVSSHLHTVVISDTMFCSVFCIFTPSHCCDVRYEDTKGRTEHRIGHHNSVKVWRYKRQNRTSYRTSQQCEGVTMQKTEHNTSHCCDVRYDVLFCRLYPHTFTLLWCPIRCSVLSFVSSHLHTIVMSDAMFCSVWRCEDTKDRTEHRIRHHNSVKVWRYKRQNRTSYQTSQQVLSFVSSHLHTVVMSDTMFCSVVCIFTPSHCCDVLYDVQCCRLYLHTFTLLWCPIRCSVLSFVSSHILQTTEQNIVSDTTTVWRCEDTKDRTEHRIRHHNSVKVW